MTSAWQGDGRRIGLALGGGGARGLAHIVALEVFDELGIRPSVISGTSIGAIFGGAYALGLPAKEIAARADEILSRPAEIARRLFSGSPRNWMELWTLRPLSAALMNPRVLVGIIFPEAASAEAESLAIPFRAVATNYHEQTPVVLRSGRLDQVIAASMALPAMFRAVDLNGCILVDGGLTDPLPYELIEPDCDITVAMDVTGRLSGRPGRSPTALETMLAASQIMQNAIIREKLRAHPPDILIRPPVDSYRLLEFYKIRKILEAAIPAKDQLKRAIDAHVTAALEKSS